MGDPKPQSLCATVAEHPKALTADFRREYQADLRQLVADSEWWLIHAYIEGMDLPTTALFRSMLAARDVDDTVDEPSPDDIVLADGLEALRLGTPRYVASVLLSLLNRQEGRDYADTPEDKRDGPFRQTLPPGYERRGALADANRPAWDSDIARMARAALIAPTDPGVTDGFDV